MMQDSTTALAKTSTVRGVPVLDLTTQSSVLMIFLRHFGCTFCRRTIGEISELMPELERRGVRPVFVHLGTESIAQAHFDYYGIPTVDHVLDSSGELYRAEPFALTRKPLWKQGLSLQPWKGWLTNLRKHGIGKIQGDVEQMPGIFLLQGGSVVRAYRYTSIADTPDYLRFIDAN